MIPDNLLAAQYGLTVEESARAVDSALEKVFGTKAWFRSREELLQDLPRKKMREVTFCIKGELEYCQVLRDYQKWRRLVRKAFPGYVIHVSPGGDLSVEMSVGDHYQRLVAIGTCPFDQVPPHERQYLKEGRTAFFFVSRVSLDETKGTSKVKIALSRTSRSLPETLLRKITGRKVRCIRRIPGAMSIIETGEFLPKPAILEVRDELKERILVHVRS